MMPMSLNLQKKQKQGPQRWGKTSSIPVDARDFWFSGLRCPPTCEEFRYIVAYLGETGGCPSGHQRSSRGENGEGPIPPFWREKHKI